jgi:RNA-directed DNA polymerase
MAFTSRAYLMDIDWLKEAHRRTRKDGAVGVDGVTAEQYEQELEGKLLQRAVVMLLEPIHEQDFLDCSFGFRPGRSAHDALTSFRDQTMNRRPLGGTVLKVDIQKFFDKLDHHYLRQFLQLRVRDGVLLRLIDKWLKAGGMLNRSRDRTLAISNPQ